MVIFWRLSHFTCEDYSLMLICSILLPILTIIFGQLGYKNTQRFISLFLPFKKSHLTTGSSEQTAVPNRSKFVNLVGNQCIHSWSNCLEKSLLLWILVRRKGIATRTRLAIRKEDSNTFILIESTEVYQSFFAFDKNC